MRERKRHQKYNSEGETIILSHEIFNAIIQELTAKVSYQCFLLIVF